MALTVDIEVKNKALSVYDQLIQEGMEKGRYEGFNEGIEKGIEKGRYEGFNEGIEKGKEDTVLNSYALNFPLNTIANITGLSEKKVEEILKKNKKL